jgi:hypothetical protein
VALWFLPCPPVSFLVGGVPVFLRRDSHVKSHARRDDLFKIYLLLKVKKEMEERHAN